MKDEFFYLHGESTEKNMLSFFYFTSHKERKPTKMLSHKNLQGKLSRNVSHFFIISHLRSFIPYSAWNDNFFILTNIKKAKLKEKYEISRANIVVFVKSESKFVLR